MLLTILIFYFSKGCLIHLKRRSLVSEVAINLKIFLLQLFKVYSKRYFIF